MAPGASSTSMILPSLMDGGLKRSAGSEEAGRQT